MSKAHYRLALVIGIGGIIALSTKPASPDEKSSQPSTENPRCPPGTVWLPKTTVHVGAPKDADALAQSSLEMGPFCVDRTEVTVDQYQACVKAGACRPPETSISFPGYGPPEPMRTELSRFCNAPQANHRQHPMNCVDHPTAENYCTWEGGRLLSEEEWEYAARGPDAKVYPWGDEPPRAGSSLLCWDRRESAKGTCEVGQFPSGASPSGALDMAGNVWEWTTGSASNGRVVRGGGWTNFLPHFVSPTYRWPLNPKTRLNCLGFRCVRPVLGGG